MKILVVSIALLAAGCVANTELASNPSPLPVHIVAATTYSGHLLVNVTNYGNRKLQYAWPLLVGSQDSTPAYCRLPAELEFHIHELEAHKSIRLEFAGHVGAGYVGLWFAPPSRNGHESWRMEFSDNIVPAPLSSAGE